MFENICFILKMIYRDHILVYTVNNIRDLCIFFLYRVKFYIFEIADRIVRSITKQSITDKFKICFFRLKPLRKISDQIRNRNTLINKGLFFFPIRKDFPESFILYFNGSNG